MKINWGIGLGIGMACFMAFILYFVVTMSTNQNFEHDLVTEDYYAKEMRYQEEIDAETNTRDLKHELASKKVKDGWKIDFPLQLSPEKIQGVLQLYRPSNAKLDQEIPLTLQNSSLIIPKEYFLAGRWNIIIDWEYEGKRYMYKESIVY